MLCTQSQTDNQTVILNYSCYCITVNNLTLPSNDLLLKRTWLRFCNEYNLKKLMIFPLHAITYSLTLNIAELWHHYYYSVQLSHFIHDPQRKCLLTISPHLSSGHIWAGVNHHFNDTLMWTNRPFASRSAVKMSAVFKSSCCSWSHKMSISDKHFCYSTENHFKQPVCGKSLICPCWFIHASLSSSNQHLPHANASRQDLFNPSSSSFA